MKGFLGVIGAGALDFLFPRPCPGCGLQAPAGIPVCESCQCTIESVDAFDLEVFLSSDDGLSELFLAATILWRYRKSDLVQVIHRQFKYENRPSYGDWIGRLLSRRATVELDPPDLVVPIPLHRTRRRERGYNQALELARPLARAFGCPLATEVLVRIRPTRPQTGLDRHERSENLRSVFSVQNGSALHGKRILLVDDVVTTGATVKSAASVLSRCGPRWICLAAMGLTGD